MRSSEINPYFKNLQRFCQVCGSRYTIGEYLDGGNERYFDSVEDYRRGCESTCLACWLGVGPMDISGEFHAPVEMAQEGDIADGFFSDARLPADIEAWWDERAYLAAYCAIVSGDLIAAFEAFLSRGFHLAILPIARVRSRKVVVFPDPFVFYPPGRAALAQLNLLSGSASAASSSERCSAVSGVTAEVFVEHSVVVFPCCFDWQKFCAGTHELQLDIIRWLSGEVDMRCLNFLRYQACRFELTDTLPAHAGQVANDRSMAGAMFYNHRLGQARLVGGAAFSHCWTRGSGLSLHQPEWDSLPSIGQVGHTVRHALSLYAAILESSDPTARFMQALAILEFLASPGEYQKFKEVKKTISRYVARTASEYHKLLDRFDALTGKTDSGTGRVMGYRTRVVHMGERLEQIVPTLSGRRALFMELDGYIRKVMDHMLEFADHDLENYAKLREAMKPFDVVEH